MTKRLEIIFSEIPSCRIFADVGCDHGYISKAMLDSGKCEMAIVSDVSAKCLSKAERLLRGYISNKKAQAIVSDGFDNLPPSDVSLIAGMGGEEIISIIGKAITLPNTLVLQPMKNCDKLRRFLVDNGYRINKDFVFFAEEKYYDLMILEKGEDTLTQAEEEFGRTNIIERGEAFTNRIRKQIETLENRLKTVNLPKDVSVKIQKEILRLKEYA
ncbi:MAG: SAM-dependent methyltransferase [Clostridiales bacterium]|nr:SAM-dependent methyltransferase [Clostridiales bacterium]